MKNKSPDTGSLDMLLDTMCNTFGGVCFIALMVAIISAALPKTSQDESAVEQVTEDQVIAKEIARLEQRRDRLQAAVDIQASFVQNASTGVVLKADLAEMVTKVAADEEQIRLYEKKLVEYQDELAKLKTSTSYSRREAMRLDRLLRELKEKVGRPLFDRHRVVRTPRERELKGLRTINIWLHQHRLYMMDGKTCVREKEVDLHDGKRHWEVSLIPGRGVLLNDDFFLHSRFWPQLQRQFSANSYVRIFVDTVSFDELCLLRDALISQKQMYNWWVAEEEVLTFTEGYDGQVQ